MRNIVMLIASYVIFLPWAGLTGLIIFLGFKLGNLARRTEQGSRSF